jgi:MFS family permease
LLLVITLFTIGCYTLSLAPVTWVLISEIFPNRLRGIGVSISVSALWSASFLLTFTFPILNRVLGNAGSFWIYSGVCLAGFFFVYLRVTETRGKTLEEIERELTSVRGRLSREEQHWSTHRKRCYVWTSSRSQPRRKRRSS